jgi:polar amino acid transport system substrate-binding protein
MLDSRRALCALAGTLAVTSAAAVACGAGGGSASAPPSNCTPRHQNVKTIDSGTFTVASFNTLPSFEYKEGQPLKGIDGELVQKLADLECLKLKVNLVQASSAIPAVQSNRADVAAGGWYLTDERKKIVDFTPPYYSDAVVFVSREGYDQVSQLQGKTVGTVQGYLWPKTLERLYGKDHVRTFQTPEAQFDDLAAGRIDVVVEGLAFGTEAVRLRPGKGLVVKKVQPDPDFPETNKPSVIAMPYTKGNDSLGAALRDDVNELLKNGDIDKYLDNAGVNHEDAKVR